MIYLDHASTTPLRPEALEAMLPVLAGTFGNPGSVHAAGRAARAALDDARDRLAVRLRAEPRELVFTSGGTESVALAFPAAAEGRAVVTAVEHPVVRTHPETGRKTLYVNVAFTRTIVGMEPIEAGRLLRRLYRQATIVDVQCRFRWQPGSVAFWDNRATQHIVANDFLPHRRVMERVTVVGDKPI